ncbi:BNR/Asp-box repeat-containing protein [Arthrobacter crystallopoietes BAB-32]|uniref:BNR/Asp-box repeat-containing protein n=1 Tax=Arthrobacter crystallopoietes BAB-32 TaxID=1246476 RepID=N1UYC5_9MICC|nr:hypothetical protein [Arthrobacter crystallopoietes]EMY32774.1 BNR/Asp-box repeat-containing protein [Arthrobacter crystallopoietes BAB-32]
MSRFSIPRARKTLLAAVAAAAVGLAAGCAQSSATEEPAAETAVVPYSHVHGISADPESGRVLLATHEGLFDVSAETPERIGPVIDLMGFSPAGDNSFYASGHPDPSSGLPDPAGLLRSDDGGKTWEPLSRQGESDFHALTVTRDGVVAYDGRVRMTEDLQTWKTSSADIHPASLAGTAQGTTVLAATEQGVQRSEDGGETWQLPADAPVLQVVAFADASTAVGVAPDGSVQVSGDAGKSWQPTGSVDGHPAAVTAVKEGSALRIWVATDRGVEYSDDGGATFRSQLG